LKIGVLREPGKEYTRIPLGHYEKKSVFVIHLRKNDMEINLMLYGGAILLGAFHAFEPGHGKALIGAYMISTKGRVIDGVILGLVVTLTHTFSVIILGVAATLLSGSFSDATLHAWLGLASAVLILLAGFWMLKTRLSPDTGHSHVHLFGKAHDHGHDHHHHDHDDTTHAHDHKHSHTHDHAADHDPRRKSSLGQILLLGISGGLVPCPAGIATLLAAIGAGRIAQGLTVTLFFSLGLGLVMMTLGIVLSQAGRITEKFSDNLKLARRLGIASAVIIISLGFYTLFNSLKDIFLP
jgi:nickel/cobalt exporter